MRVDAGSDLAQPKRCEKQMRGFHLSDSCSICEQHVQTGFPHVACMEDVHGRNLLEALCPLVMRCLWLLVRI